MTKFSALKRDFAKALSRLEEALEQKKSRIVRDAAIKRFEFTFDISWKLMKALLEEKKGIVCASPKECIKLAYNQGIIDFDKTWIDVVDLRNEIVHEYSEEYANGLYAKLPKVAKLFANLKAGIEKNMH